MLELVPELDFRLEPTLFFLPTDLFFADGLLAISQINVIMILNDKQQS
jgi:hypothetical protein